MTLPEFGKAVKSDGIEIIVKRSEGNMVTDYLSSKECCGCMLCAEICPVDAIQEKNISGFFSPFIDKGRCIGCKKCIRLCPVINADNLKSVKRNKEIVIASNKSLDKKQKSTSGGVFIELAAAVIHGGVLSTVRNTRTTGVLGMQELHLKIA